MPIERIVHGKAQIQGIVAMEVVDDICTYWTEVGGILEEHEMTNRFWLLCNKKIDNRWMRMGGDLHYKWGRQFTTREDFTKTRNFSRTYDTFSIWDAKESLMVKDGLSYFLGLSIKDVSVLSFDIETTGIVHDHTSKVLIISNTYRNSRGEKQSKLFCYDDYPSDKDMFDAWTAWVREMNPSIILGHNIYGYDFGYLAFAMQQAGASLNLGRDGSELKFAVKESQFRKDGSQSYAYKKCHIYGREIIDTMFLSYKYDVGRKYESYSLKAIIKHEGLEVEGRQFYDAGSIKDNYKNPVEWEKIKKYADEDAEDALALYDLMAPSFFYMAQSIPKPFQLINESATGSQINSMMMRAYLQDKHSLPKTTEGGKYEGAIAVARPGIYKNALRWDANALYPSIMRQYKIGLGGKDPNEVFIKLTEYFATQRQVNKKLAKETGEKYYDDLQSSQKIFSNSLYGFCSAPGLLFNHPESAATITKHGRGILLKAIKWISGLEESDVTKLTSNYNEKLQ